MVEDLLGSLKVEIVDRTDIRTIVAQRIKFLRSEFKGTPTKLDQSIQDIALKLQEKWIEQEKLFRKKSKKEKPIQRLDRYKRWAKEYRLLGLLDLSNQWYAKLRKQRAELALITAMYEFSEIDAIASQKNKFVIQEIKDLKSVSLRIQGPSVIKPKRKNGKNTIQIGIVIEEFVKPLSDIISQSRYNKRYERYIKRLVEKLNAGYKQERKSIPSENLEDQKLLLRKYQILAIQDLFGYWEKQLRSLKIPPNLKKDLQNLCNRVIVDESGQNNKKEIKKTGLKVLKFYRKTISSSKTVNFTMRNIKFNFKESFNKMLAPLIEVSFVAEEKIKSLIVPTKKLTLKTKIKRYKDTLIAREYLTIVCQAVAPRQSELNKILNSNDDKEN